MLYLIGGASRSGKSLMAKKILAEKGITYLSLDWLVMGFTNGLPAYGIHDKLMPDEIAERSWPFVKAMLESMLYTEEDGVIEGEALLPELVVELREKFPDQLRICFVGYVDVPVEEKVKNIKKHGGGKEDGLMDKSDSYIIDHVHNMIAHSIKIKRSCVAHDVKYFDTANHFPVVMEETIAYLVG